MEKKISNKNGLSKDGQLSLEFSSNTKPSPEIQKTFNTRVINISENNLNEKTNIDYSKLVLKYTKSF